MSTPWPKEEPPPRGRCLPNVRTMLGTWISNYPDGIDHCEYCHRETSDPIEGHDGMCFVSATHFMVRLYDTDLAAARKERDALLAMLNTNQARAQSAAQSAAKIAQDLQIYLREHTSDVVKLEA